MTAQPYKHRKHVNKVKVVFSIFAVVWMATIVFIAQDRTLEKKTAELERETQYLRYKVELAGNDGGTFKSALALAFSTFDLLKSPDGISRSSAAEDSPDTARAVPVLLYHGLVDKPDRFAMTPENFKEQMFALKRAGYEAVGLEELEKFVNGEEKLPDKSFVLTFDDGRVDAFREADPVLKALGWRAVMFIATGQSFPDEVANHYYLIGDQIVEMRDTGRWEIGSHAVQYGGGFVPISPDETGNFLSNKRWLATQGRVETDDEYATRVAGELSASRDKLESVLGDKITAFAFPFGDYGQQGANLSDSQAEPVIAEAVADNYKLAFFQTWPKDSNFSLNYSGDEPLALRRIEPNSEWTADQLLAELRRAQSKEFPYTDSLQDNNGWKNPWGDMSFGEGGLALRTTPETTGSFAFLDGTKHWKDYAYAVETAWRKGGYLTLFARYKDSENYASCTFGDDLVKAEEKVDGEITKLVSTDNPISVPRDAGQYAVVVSGSQIKCYEGGAVAVISFRLDEKLRNGGIGLRIWDREIGNGDITFSSLRVVPAGDAGSLTNSLPLYEKQ